MEVLRPNPALGRLRFAVFDFDGTLSLLRVGWQAVMADHMVDVLRAVPGAAQESQLRSRVDEPVHNMAGRPTLDQMQWLADEVRRLGGKPQPAEAYKQEYLLRLSQRVRRRADLEAGRLAPQACRVPGALAFVTALRAAGVDCRIASGTDEAAVRHEAGLLGFAELVSQIRGARADGTDAKLAVIQEIASAHAPAAGELAVFGDGGIEMAHARANDGLAIGVASNEDGQPGVDALKRQLLIAAGADVIVPDFTPRALLTYLWPIEG